MPGGAFEQGMPRQQQEVSSFGYSVSEPKGLAAHAFFQALVRAAVAIDNARLVEELRDSNARLEEQAVELEASKEQLMQTEAWYRGILQSAPDGMLVVDTRGVIRLVNAAIKQREVDERITLDDAQVIAVLEKMVKQRKEWHMLDPDVLHWLMQSSPQNQFFDLGREQVHTTHNQHISLFPRDQTADILCHT